MTGFGDWLLGIIRSILQFFIDIPLHMAQWLWEALLELLDTSGIVGMIQTASRLMELVDPGVWFFLSFTEFPYGVKVIFTAYLIRFLIRRVPFIG